jgi:hypothetical protein
MADREKTDKPVNEKDNCHMHEHCHEDECHTHEHCHDHERGHSHDHDSCGDDETRAPSSTRNEPPED